MGGAADIHFSDGTKLKKVDQAGYLGGIITEDSNRNTELGSRLSKAIGTCHKLRLSGVKQLHQSDRRTHPAEATRI